MSFKEAILIGDVLKCEVWLPPIFSHHTADAPHVVEVERALDLKCLRTAGFAVRALSPDEWNASTSVCVHNFTAGNDKWSALSGYFGDSPTLAKSTIDSRGAAFATADSVRAFPWGGASDIVILNGLFNNVHMYECGFNGATDIKSCPRSASWTPWLDRLDTAWRFSAPIEVAAEKFVESTFGAAAFVAAHIRLRDPARPTSHTNPELETQPPDFKSLFGGIDPNDIYSALKLCAHDLFATSSVFVAIPPWIRKIDTKMLASLPRLDARTLPEMIQNSTTASFVEMAICCRAVQFLQSSTNFNARRERLGYPGTTFGALVRDRRAAEGLPSSTLAETLAWHAKLTGYRQNET